MDKSTHEVRLAQWKEIVRKCQSRPEGQTAASWLEENGIHNKQYYYWLRQIRKEAYEEMKDASLPAASAPSAVTFAEIPVQTSVQSEIYSGFHPDAVIHFGGAGIAVSNTASAELLGRIMETISHAR